MERKKRYVIVRSSTLNELESKINAIASCGFVVVSSIHSLRVRLSDLDVESEFKLVVVMERRKGLNEMMESLRRA